MEEIFVGRDLHFVKGGQGMLLHKYVPSLFQSSIFEKNMEQEVVQDKAR